MMSGSKQRVCCNAAALLRPFDDDEKVIASIETAAFLCYGNEGFSVDVDSC